MMRVRHGRRSCVGMDVICDGDEYLKGFPNKRDYLRSVTTPKITSGLEVVMRFKLG